MMNEPTIKKLTGAHLTFGGVIDAAKPYVVSTVAAHHQETGMIWLCAEEHEAERRAEQLRFWLSVLGNTTTTATLFPALEQPLTLAGISGEDSDMRTDARERSHLLIKLLGGTSRQIMVASLAALRSALPTPAALKRQTLKIAPSMPMAPEMAMKRLSESGYVRVERVVLPGDMAKRGGVLDVFSPGREHPIRIEFVGDEIENVGSFDPKHSTKIRKLASAECAPLITKDDSYTLRDYLPFLSHVRIVADDPSVLLEKESEKETAALTEQFDRLRTLFFTSPLTTKNLSITFDFVPPPLFNNHLEKFAAAIKLSHDKRVIILSNYKPRIASYLKKRSIAVDHVAFSEHIFSDYPSLGGFESKDEKILFLTDRDIFRPAAKSKRYRQKQLFISAIREGDYVVHLDHGIGQFVGLTRRKIEEETKDFFILEYAEGDKLYLPVEYSDKITKYVGGSHPPLHRLHGGAWRETKKRIKLRAQLFAKELLELYAERELAPGFSFPVGAAEMQALENSFTYEETPDQERTWKEVSADMEKSSENTFDEESGMTRPMDRLICGDVGFGKTEIAIRAAFKAVLARRQVALLAPTTILAQQHYDTFKKRFSSFPVRVAVLSRFMTTQEQKDVIQTVSRGDADVVIGTHRLLSHDIAFKNLGLLIIDEEQKFGVKQKEKLKTMRSEVDILTLTATPIPRTLQFSLAGLRDMSIIKTPPVGRKAIVTTITPFDENTIKVAIERELKRDGQVYYLHNRVETIAPAAERLRKLIPSARVGIAHGQLAERELLTMMEKFDNGKINLLVCSSIIENGLDLPNVNTLIVDEATNFGLAELYQLRGRIGRGDEQAYAFFFYHEKKLKDAARKRLEALMEAERLGSGFELAMRDMEIRGSGNILGKEQSGNIKAVGLTLYSQLLLQTVEEMRTGIVQEEKTQVTIDLPLNAYIPETYIASQEERIIVYQKITSCEEKEELQEVREEIKKTYGAFPREVDHVFFLIHIKLLAQRAKLRNIDLEHIHHSGGGREHILMFEFAWKPNYEKVQELMTEEPAWELTGKKLKIPFTKLGEEWQEKLIDILSLLGS